MLTEEIECVEELESDAPDEKWERFRFVMEGRSPLLLHADNIEAAEDVDNWRRDPANAKLAGKKKADDRSPAWTWFGYVPISPKGMAAIPDTYLTAMMIGAGSMIDRTGRGRKTLKEIAATAVRSLEEQPFFDLEIKPVSEGLEKCLAVTIEEQKKLMAPVEYKTVNIAAIAAGLGFTPGKTPNNSFADHIQAARAAGFKFDMRRAKIGASKHIRIRPYFRYWRVRGVIECNTLQVPFEQLKELFRIAGDRGLGDWRPSSPRPGKFGMFNTTVSPIK